MCENGERKNQGGFSSQEVKKSKTLNIVNASRELKIPADEKGKWRREEEEKKRRKREEEDDEEEENRECARSFLSLLSFSFSSFSSSRFWWWWLFSRETSAETMMGNTHPSA